MCMEIESVPVRPGDTSRQESTMATRKKSTSTKDSERKDAAHEEVHKAAIAVARARVTLANANKRLEDSVAAHITTAPHSPAWYMRPGILTIPEVQGAADLTEEQLHKLMERQQPRAKERRRKERAKAKGKTRKRKSMTPRTDADDRPPGF